MELLPQSEQGLWLEVVSRGEFWKNYIVFFENILQKQIVILDHI